MKRYAVLGSRMKFVSSVFSLSVRVKEKKIFFLKSLSHKAGGAGGELACFENQQNT